MSDNLSFNVYEKIKKEERKDWVLYVDAVYKADPRKSVNISAEVLSKLVGVKNQGGFRYLGRTSSPNLVVLYTTGDDVYWRDEINNQLGVFLYYGDNKKPGNDLHKTNLHGNEILRDMFAYSCSDDIEVRKKIPPVLVFRKTEGRDVKFLGLAVPGISGKPKKEWLTAVWGCNKDGDRFQNYKAYFTILNTSSGSDEMEGYGINLAWINDIENGEALTSVYAPKVWKRYIQNSQFSPLIAKMEKFVRNKDEQLPTNSLQKEMLKIIHDYFIRIDNGYSFEKFAADIAKKMDNQIVDIETTRPYKDGGFDAEGTYRIFNNVENSVLVSFYLQAKCYSSGNSVKVNDTSRLISRIKDRQFGIMITTSYVAEQAYKEILEDGHPIVIICGKDIIDYIYNEMEIRDKASLNRWLEVNYSKESN